MGKKFVSTKTHNDATHNRNFMYNITRVCINCLVQLFFFSFVHPIQLK